MQLSRTSPNIIKISTKRCHCPTPANSLANKLLSIYSLAYLAPYSRALVWDCDSVSWAFSVPPRDEAKEDNNGILCVTYFTQARWQARDDSLHPPQRRGNLIVRKIWGQNSSHPIYSVLMIHQSSVVATTMMGHPLEKLAPANWDPTQK